MEAYSDYRPRGREYAVKAKTGGKPLFEAGDLVKLKEEYVAKVLNHKKVFALYVEIGMPRDWIVSLCNQNPMRVQSISQDLNKEYVIELLSDPRDVVWQQEWFELVSKDNFVEVDDLFEI